VDLFLSASGAHAAHAAPGDGASPGSAHPVTRRRPAAGATAAQSVRASSRSVFARAWRIPYRQDSRRAPARRAAQGSARPPRRRSPQRHPIRGSRLEPNSSSASGVVIDPTRRAHHHLRDRDLTEIAMHIQPDRLPADLTTSSSWLLNSRRSSGLTTTTDTSSRLNRESRRGVH
jgi:hypothetical protein